MSRVESAPACIFTANASNSAMRLPRNVRIRDRNGSAQPGICGALYSIDRSALFSVGRSGCGGGRPLPAPRPGRRGRGSMLARGLALRRRLDRQTCRRALPTRNLRGRFSLVLHQRLQLPACARAPASSPSGCPFVRGRSPGTRLARNPPSGERSTPTPLSAFLRLYRLPQRWLSSNLSQGAVAIRAGRYGFPEGDDPPGPGNRLSPRHGAFTARALMPP